MEKETCASGQSLSSRIQTSPSRAMIQPVMIPTVMMVGRPISASRRVGFGTPAMTKLRKKPNSAMAAASFKRLSPSTIRASRCGVAMLRKIETTAEGSVVETIAPRSRQASGVMPLNGTSAMPTKAVATMTASTAMTRIGTQSSSIRRRSRPSAT